MGADFCGRGKRKQNAQREKDEDRRYMAAVGCFSSGRSWVTAKPKCDQAISNKRLPIA